jgi:hypothetical protein
MTSNRKELFLIRIPSTIDIKSINGSLIDLNKSGNLRIAEQNVDYSYDCDYKQNNCNINVTKLNELDQNNFQIDNNSKLKAYISFRVNRNLQNESSGLKTLRKRQVIEPIINIVKKRNDSKHKLSSKKKKKRKTINE